eukprot:8923669-Pyramimonas_sp.AAC.1
MTSGAWAPRWGPSRWGQRIVPHRRCILEWAGGPRRLISGSCEQKGGTIGWATTRLNPLQR